MKRPIRLWSGVAAAWMMLLLLSGCADSSGKLQGSRLDLNILLVQSGHPILIPDITYKDAYEHFFGNPQWRGFRSDEGSDIVEFSGECTYKEEPAAVYIQFLIDGEDTEGERSFSMHHISLSCNGEEIPVNVLLFAELSFKPFSAYAQEVLGQPLDQDVEDVFSALSELNELYDLMGESE